MTTRDRLLGLSVVLLWGLNFLAIRVGLDHFPPFFFAALRFAVLAIPTLLFIPRPPVRMRWIVLYGTGFGILQFAFLFTAMRAGMPTGLASLVLQSSAPFTVLLGALFLGERIRTVQIVGVAVAVAGMTVIGWDRLQHATLLPVLLTLAGGLGWALGNIGARSASTEAPGGNPLHLMLWTTTVPPLPLFAMSAFVEGPATGPRALADSFSLAGLPAVLALAYITLLATVVGTGLWTFLMGRYPAGVVAPFSLLVPVVGIAAAWVVLDETPTAFSLAGGVVVIVGAFAATASKPRAAAVGTVTAPHRADPTSDDRAATSDDRAATADDAADASADAPASTSAAWAGSARPA